MTIASSDGMATGLIIGAIVFGLVVLGLMIWLVYGTLYKVLAAVPPQFRQMSPGHVFLCLIPLFGIVWLFFVVSRTSNSLLATFQAQGRMDVGDCGRSIGLAWAILVCCGIIPFLGGLASLAGLVCMIIYLVKVNGLRHQIAPGYPA